MNKQQIENLCELVAHLSALTVGGVPSSTSMAGRLRKTAKTSQEIHKHARALTALAEHDCNVGLDARQERRWGGLCDKINGLLLPYGRIACFSGDPRGYVVKIQGLPGNTWGGDSEGFGVG